MSIYGYCSNCGHPLVPIYFKDKEIINGHPTGRTRTSISYLLCENCGNKEIVDDSFDGRWN